MGNNSVALFKEKDEVDKEKKEPDTNDKFRYCAISNKPLGPYVVTCGLGRLYNRIEVLQAILDRSKLPASASHIQNMMDVRDMRLTINPNKNNTLPFVCPIRGVEMSDKHRFIFNWRCGCVMSEAVFMSDYNRCLKCLRSYIAFDLIILYGTDMEVELLRNKLEARRMYEQGRRDLNVNIAPVDMLRANTTSLELMRLIRNFKRPIVYEEEVEGVDKKKLKRTTIITERDKIEVVFGLIALAAVIFYMYTNRKSK